MMSNKTDRKGAVMAKRRKLRSGKDKRVYTQTAQRVKKINVAPKMARGGIRL